MIESVLQVRVENFKLTEALRHQAPPRNSRIKSAIQL